MTLAEKMRDNLAKENSDSVLEISRRFASPRELVFKAMTQPDVFKQWWGPKGCDCHVCEVDLRVGGKWCTIIVNKEDGASNTVSGIYKEIDDPSKLVFTWAWTQEDGTLGHETEVSITLHDEGAKTLMEFTQKIFQEPDHCHKHRMGWDSAYDCLDELLAAAN